MLDLKQQLQGIVASLHTPFTDNNTVDQDSLTRLVKHCGQSGCSGILVSAVAGEVSTLTADEREQLLKCVSEAADSQLTIVAGISAPTINESIELARNAARFAVPVLLWQPTPGLDQEQILQGLKCIAAEGDHQIMLQDLDWTGSGLAPECIAELARQVPAFTAIKIETAPAGPKYSAVSEATQRPLHMSGGWAAMQMLDGLSRDLDAFVPSGLLPVQVRIFSAWTQGDKDAARRLFESILPVLVFSNQHIDVSIRFWKYVRFRQGIFSTANCRLPPPLDAIQRIEAKRLCDRVIELEAQASKFRQ